MPADAFAQYTPRLIQQGRWSYIDRAHADELREVVAAEIQALTGCAAEVADRAAGAFINERSAPGFGLDAAASNDPALTMKAATALDAWIASKAAAQAEAA